MLRRCTSRLSSSPANTRTLRANARKLRALAIAGVGSKVRMDLAAVIELFEAAREVNLAKPNIVRLGTKGPATHTTVCGDLRGYGTDLLNIFDSFGEPSPKNPYLFNGNLVGDGGLNGLEICVILASYMVEQPKSIFVNRGFHEMGFNFGCHSAAEAIGQKHYPTAFPPFDKFIQAFFNALPIAHIVDDSVFVVHGGPAANRSLTIKQLNALKRDADKLEGALEEMLESEPISCVPRGGQYDEAATDKFLHSVGCNSLLNSVGRVYHHGYKMHFNGKCATLSSAPKHREDWDYIGPYDCRGAVAKFVHGEGGKPHWSSLIAVR